MARRRTDLKISRGYAYMCIAAYFAGGLRVLGSTHARTRIYTYAERARPVDEGGRAAKNGLSGRSGMRPDPPGAASVVGPPPDLSSGGNIGRGRLIGTFRR